MVEEGTQMSTEDIEIVTMVDVKVVCDSDIEAVIMFEVKIVPDFELVIVTVAGDDSGSVLVTEKDFGIVTGSGVVIGKDGLAFGVVIGRDGPAFGVVHASEMDFEIVIGSDLRETVIGVEFGIVTGTEVEIETLDGFDVETVSDAVAGLEIGVVAEAETEVEVELGPKGQHKYYRVPALDFQDRSEKQKAALGCRGKLVPDECYGKMLMEFEEYGVKLMLLTR
ncbi:hypothetical protein SLE2022_314930 [Rubroshorea leprosula]